VSDLNEIVEEFKKKLDESVSTEAISKEVKVGDYWLLVKLSKVRFEP
jgi:hypothetical protein